MPVYYSYIIPILQLNYIYIITILYLYIVANVMLQYNNFLLP